MRPALAIRPPQTDEVDTLDAVLGMALHFPLGGMRERITILGPDNFRAVLLDGRIIAGFGFVRMGQWFNGARVPLVGLTAVGVVPEYRGSGIGSLMLRRALEELQAEGSPLSALYPATLPYYQRVGYERAGVRVTYELPLEAIDVREQTLDLVPLEPGQYEALYRIYEQRARRTAGNLDRPAWIWQQKLEPKDRQAFRYLVARDGHSEGYVVFTQGGRSDPLTVLDVCVLTPEAGRRLLTLFAGYRSMVEHVIWSGGPFDPFVYLLGEQLTAGSRSRVRIIRALDWMLRIVDIAGALSMRGYPPGLNAEVHLDIVDNLLPVNNGRFVLEVADGRGVVRPGGQGRIRLGIRELAALYTGFMAPAELRTLGVVDASDEQLALAGVLFAGPRPWIADMF